MWTTAKSFAFIAAALLGAALPASADLPDVVLSASGGQTVGKEFDIGSPTAQTSFWYTVNGLEAGKSANISFELSKSGSTYYAVTVRFAEGAQDYLELQRVVNGVTTVLNSAESYTGGPGSFKRMPDFNVGQTEDYPTLYAKWFTGSPSVSLFEISANDTSDDQIWDGNNFGISLSVENGAVGTTTVDVTWIRVNTP